VKINRIKSPTEKKQTLLSHSEAKSCHNMLQTIKPIADLVNEGVQKYPRVLIVEDDEVLASVLKMTFEERGYQADIALTGLEAEKMFKEKTYGVAVLDHHLPDTKGDKLMIALKLLCPDAVYLAMSNDLRPELAQEWMKHGASAFVSKPFEPQYLIELYEQSQRK